jgi:hypothetical protein
MYSIYKKQMRNYEIQDIIVNTSIFIETDKQFYKMQNPQNNDAELSLGFFKNLVADIRDIIVYKRFWSRILIFS